MFVNGDPYLISVSAPLGLTTVNHLSGKRNFASVRGALYEQLDLYKSEGFDITTILNDGEGAVAKLTTLLRGRGIHVNPTGAGQHVANIERKIRVVKERCRVQHIAISPQQGTYQVDGVLCCITNQHSTINHINELGQPTRTVHWAQNRLQY